MPGASYEHAGAELVRRNPGCLSSASWTNQRRRFSDVSNRNPYLPWPPPRIHHLHVGEVLVATGHEGRKPPPPLRLPVCSIGKSEESSESGERQFGRFSSTRRREFADAPNMHSRDRLLENDGAFRPRPRGPESATASGIKIQVPNTPGSEEKSFLQLHRITITALLKVLSSLTVPWICANSPLLSCEQATGLPRESTRDDVFKSTV